MTAYSEKDLLWPEDGDDGDVNEEALVATRTLITAAGLEVPVSTKGYVELLRILASEVQTARRESQAASCELSVRKAKLGELERKIQILTGDVRRAADLQKELSA